jgi:hypothetical protein
MGHAATAAHRWAARNQHPQHDLAALAHVAQAGEPLSGAGQQLRRIRAWERALRPKPCRLVLHRELRWRVAQKLALQW